MSLVLADPTGRDLSQRRVLAEVLLKGAEDAAVLGDRPFARLRRLIAIDCLCEREARALRLRLFDLERPLRERLLRVLLRPVGAEDADLLPVLSDRHKAPGFALGALTGDLPSPLPDFRHWLLPPSLGVHCY